MIFKIKDKAKNFLDKNLSLILIVGLLLTVTALYVIQTDKHDVEIAHQKGIIEMLEREKKREQLKRLQEAHIRVQARYEDSITIAHLKMVKKRDSIYYVKSISKLRQEITKLNLTDEELDNKLIKAYETSNK
jgi:hypothetical protein